MKLCNVILFILGFYVLLVGGFVGFRYYEIKNSEDLIYQLTTDENKEVISIYPPDLETIIQFMIVIDDWNNIKKWCEGKTNCHELAIKADGEINYFTYEELINYAKLRSTKGEEK